MNLEELKNLSAAATKGPWQAGPMFFGTSKGDESEIIGRGEKIDIKLVTEMRNHFDALLAVTEAAIDLYNNSEQEGICWDTFAVFEKTLQTLEEIK